MSFGIYLVGYIILIAGLAIGDALVAAKKMTQPREDEILTNLDKWLAAGGTFPHGGWGHPFQAPASTSTTPAS